MRTPHVSGKAKAVIHLFMAGAPSQLELFDEKPMLTEFEGKPLPKSVIGDQRYAFIQPDAAVLGPRFQFQRHGESGALISETMPHLARIADQVCFIKSLHTDQFNHAPAQIFLNTGFSQPGRPSLGSWALYGLGSETPKSACFRGHEHRIGTQRRSGTLVQRISSVRFTRACSFGARAIRF